MNEEIRLENTSDKDFNTCEKKEYLTGLANENYQKFKKMFQRYLNIQSSNDLSREKNDTHMHLKNKNVNFFIRFLMKMIGKFKNQIKRLAKNSSQFNDKSINANEIENKCEDDEEFEFFLQMIQRYNTNFDKFKILSNENGTQLNELIERHDRFNQHWDKELIRLKELYNFGSS